MNSRVVVIGAGPTGLGAGVRLHQLRHQNWQLFEAEEAAGGLAASFVDANGFVWDLGGHVIFSHYVYFDELLDHALVCPENWLTHQRESWVWMRGAFIPYPLQNNVHRLPKDELIKCLDGLLDVHKAGLEVPRAANFREWILQKFGRGLAESFMFPYNFKVWACDASEMNVEWMGERVALVDVKKIIANVVKGEDELGWGPNATFRYPRHGGTGEIWRAAYATLPDARKSLGKAVVSIDVAAKSVEFADGDTTAYDTLISTMPLDLLLKSLKNLPAQDAWIVDEASKLRYSGSHIVGVGLRGSPPPHVATKCWLYYPEANVPFYRVTVFSNYSPNNVPATGGPFWSLMCEISESPAKPVDAASVVEDTIAGLIATGMIPPEAEVVSRWHKHLARGYPTPFLGRDLILSKLQPVLQRLGIYSRGRFGGWKYEVGNQDHSLMQGVECVDAILFGGEEMTYLHPNVVNASKSTTRHHTVSLS